MILRILNGKIVTASFSAKDTLRLDFIQEKIGTAVDTEALEKQAEAMRGQLKQVLGTKIRLERQMDTLDIGDPHYERKISDLQRRYDEQYVIAAEIEEEIDGVEKQIRCIRQEKISGDNIYRLLLAFDEVYHSATEVEEKEFMKAFIERIDLYPEKRKDGCWMEARCLRNLTEFHTLCSQFKCFQSCIRTFVLCLSACCLYCGHFLIAEFIARCHYSSPRYSIAYLVRRLKWFT